MDENGWTRAELARQLGVNRAWVTKVLQSGSPTSAATA
ncbi:MAG: helix-turn-helix transcriptional regulator [Fidelibacterota bacterium]|nr:MAG: helix-turn-helix transcriptional regulator [Candidatus Neomarinimicrobiota bacterium]